MCPVCGGELDRTRLAVFDSRTEVLCVACGDWLHDALLCAYHRAWAAMRPSDTSEFASFVI